jgi:hypothetical protein
MDIDFEDSDFEEMPDLNLAGSAVQPYMFELTKELKVKSPHQEVKKFQIPTT